MPLDLRAKQTRAMRRRLSPEDSKLVTEKQKKRQRHFPQRNFAVKVSEATAGETSRENRELIGAI